MLVCRLQNEADFQIPLEMIKAIHIETEKEPKPLSECFVELLHLTNCLIAIPDDGTPEGFQIEMRGHTPVGGHRIPPVELEQLLRLPGGFRKLEEKTTAWIQALTYYTLEKVS